MFTLNEHPILGEMQNKTENIGKKCLDISRHRLLIMNLKLTKNQETDI